MSTSIYKLPYQGGWGEVGIRTSWVLGYFFRASSLEAKQHKTSAENIVVQRRDDEV